MLVLSGPLLSLHLQTSHGIMDFGAYHPEGATGTAQAFFDIRGMTTDNYAGYEESN